MIYLKYITFPDSEIEFDFLLEKRRNFSYYPFKVLSSRGLERIDFEPITILYGGNGSGKSTALNVIAEKTKVERDSIFNKSDIYADYVEMCTVDILDKIPDDSKIITSDDVFDFMLNMRNLNEGIYEKRKDLQKKFLDAKYSEFKLKSINDYDELVKVNKARSKTQTKYIDNELVRNVDGHSNGESAFAYFVGKIGENALYILDEPENSLSPKLQIELQRLIEDSARFFGCQFVISTHSPFLLSIKGAKIYNLDENPVVTRKWTCLENVRSYYEFFKIHNEEFLNE